jgi:hypothetical protein
VAQACFHPQGNLDLASYGDLDASGAVTVADALCVLLTALWWSSPTSAPPACSAALPLEADLGCDGVVGVDDVTLALWLSVSGALPLAVDALGAGCADACTACVEPNETSCLIAGVCRAQNEAHPSNACMACVPAANDAGWTPLPNGTPCAANSECQAGQCIVVVPPFPAACNGPVQAVQFSGASVSVAAPVNAVGMYVKAWGGGGGGGGSYGFSSLCGTGGAGGGGAYAFAAVPVVGGESLTVAVGGGGSGGGFSINNQTCANSSAPGGFNGGGTAAKGSCVAAGGGGGGGFSAILRGSTALVVAAGGGGGGGAGAHQHCGYSGQAGAGGGASSAGATAGASSSSTGLNGVAYSFAGGSGGGGGGVNGGGGGVHYVGSGGFGGGGGGAGGTSLGTTVNNGAGATPGNAADSARSGAGQGGAAANALATSGGPGAPGRVVIQWCQ